MESLILFFSNLLGVMRRNPTPPLPHHYSQYLNERIFITPEQYLHLLESNPDIYKEAKIVPPNKYGKAGFEIYKNHLSVTK